MKRALPSFESRRSAWLVIVLFALGSCVDTAEPGSEGEGEGEGEGETGCVVTPFEGQCTFDDLCDGNAVGQRMAELGRTLNGPCSDDADCVWIESEIRCTPGGPLISGGCGVKILAENACLWTNFVSTLTTEVCEACGFDACTAQPGSASCGSANAICLDGICR